MTPSPNRAISGTRATGPLVLVADEDVLVRDMYASELTAAGFSVVETADGADAIVKALLYGPLAVVLDLALPEIDGFRVVRRLRADPRTKDVTILAVADRKTAQVELLAFSAGCDGFLDKPVVGATLVAELRRLMEQRPAVDVPRAEKA